MTTNVKTIEDLRREANSIIQRFKTFTPDEWNEYYHIAYDIAYGMSKSGQVIRHHGVRQFLAIVILNQILYRICELADLYNIDADAESTQELLNEFAGNPMMYLDLVPATFDSVREYLPSDWEKVVAAWAED